MFSMFGRRYDMDDVNEFIAWIACPLTIIYYIPKIAPFINVLQGLIRFEDTPGFFTTMCYIKCFFWYLYGDMLFNDQMKYAYFVATCICLTSMSIYLIYEVRKYFLDTVLNLVILLSASWGVYRYITVVRSDDDQYLVKLCAITSFFVQLFHVHTIYRVIKEKNFNLIKYNYELIHIFAEIIWSAYGFIDKDPIMGVSYGFGVILILIELYLYKRYKNKYPLIKDKDNLTIGIENTGNEELKNDEINFKTNDEFLSSKMKIKPVKILNKIE